jgi:hypothetical protein
MNTSDTIKIARRLISDLVRNRPLKDSDDINVPFLDRDGNVSFAVPKAYRDELVRRIREIDPVEFSADEQITVSLATDVLVFAAIHMLIEGQPDWRRAVLETF